MWGDVRVYNDGSATVVVDAYELVDASAHIAVVGAGVVPVQLMTTISTSSSLPPGVTDTVAAMPLRGFPIQPASTAGWTRGALLVFILSVPRPGDYTGASAIRLRYHVDSYHYTSTIRATLEVCAGADASGGVCPLASAPAS